MKFSYSLLSALVPRIPAKAQLADLLSQHTFEVEEVSKSTLDLKLAANRYADAASHWGVAREVAAISGLSLQLPKVKLPALPTDEGTLAVKVAAKDACSHYSVRAFDVSKLARRTPPQILRVLRECGLQPISPIVDLMNYVMLETGQPLHAFDADKLSGALTIRWGKAGETLEGLDGVRYGLAADTLVIADRKGPQAIAGIRGGSASGVSPSTTRIVVEAATFDGAAVGRASRKLRLVTDASVRFSHGLSPALADVGLARATQLLLELGAAATDSLDWYPKVARDRAISFDLDAHERLGGAPASEKEARKIFVALGFSVAAGSDPRTLSVSVPATRVDVATPEDLSEELARVAGYSTLPATPLPVFAVPAHDDHSVLARDRATDFAVSCGFDEVRTSSFLAPRDWEALAPYPGLLRGDLVRVANPISEERTHLRPSLLPHLVSAARAALRELPEVRVAEVGTADANFRGQLDERQLLGLVSAAPGDEGVFEVKGAIEELLARHDVAGHWHQDGPVLSFVSGGEVAARATVFEAGKVLAGAGEVDLGFCLMPAVRQYAELPRFPGVVRDVAFVASQSTPAGDVVAAAADSGVTHLASVSLLERYRGAGLPAGSQSLTLRLAFRSAEGTLTDAQVDEAVAKVASAVRSASGAKLR